MSPVLYIVVPCYKDADVIPVTGPVFLQKLEALISCDQIAENSRVLLVNDGSPDKTWDAICAFAKNAPRVIGIDLAFNCGEKYALVCGMEYAVNNGADCVITADSDLQDDLGVIPEMLSYFGEGKEIVLGVRSSRRQDSIAERFFSRVFYFVMRLLRTGLVADHSDFRLMSASAVRELLKYNGKPYFMPALVSSLPLPRAIVYYVRTARAAGSSSYGLRDKFRLAVDAIFAHSSVLPKLSIIGAVLCAFLALAAILLYFFGVLGDWLWIPSFLGVFGAVACVVVYIGVRRFFHTQKALAGLYYHIAHETDA